MLPALEADHAAVSSSHLCWLPGLGPHAALAATSTALLGTAGTQSISSPKGCTKHLFPDLLTN